MWPGCGDGDQGADGHEGSSASRRFRAVVGKRSLVAGGFPREVGIPNLGGGGGGIIRFRGGFVGKGCIWDTSNVILLVLGLRLLVVKNCMYV